MKKASIEIRAKFGSKFQERFARDSLFTFLKGWRAFTTSTHKDNHIALKINGSHIGNLDWFNWDKADKNEKF